MKLMTKEIAIEGFKNVCLSNFDMYLRIIAVGSQYNRSVWEINHPLIGLIRIKEDAPSITVFVFVDSLYAKNTDNGGAYNFKISNEEYNELKKLYFSDIRESDFIRVLNEHELKHL